MGCLSSTDKGSKKESPEKAGKSPDKRQKYEVPEDNGNKPAKSLNDFQISAGDFLKAKSTKFRDEYELKDQLGSGAYGEVRKVIHKKSKLTRAVKIIRKDAIDNEEKDKLLAEVKILNSLDHPHIMRIFEMFEEKGKYYIVSEFLEGGELFDRIIQNDHFSEREAAKIMQQILSAVAYCQKHGVVHRDLKPENLIYDSKNKDAHLKVIDFGTAKHVKPNQKLHETYGTAYYMAPEVLTGNYTDKCDVWSCGVIMYILLSGSPPFPGRDDKDILKKVKIGKYNFDDSLWSNVSEDAKSLIRKLMEFNQDKRLSAQQALDDHWFKKVMEKEEVDRPLAKENLLRLKNLRFESKLQEATWVFLVNYFSTKEEKDKLLKTFKQLDLDNDGQLTKEELIHGYIKIMGMTAEDAQDEAEKIMKTLDSNKSGSIDYSEFVKATISRSQLLTKDRLEAAFKLFDRDGNGTISADEMRVLFSEGKTQGIPEKVWEDWIKQVDANGDGGISLAEFKVMMMALMEGKDEKNTKDTKAVKK